MNHLKPHRPFVLGSMLIALAVCGCNRQAEPQASGDPGATAASQAEQAGDQARSELSRQADAAAQSVDQAATAARQATESAAASAAQAVSDAAITASIKSKLAADATLKAIDINVDTAAGRVVLQGTAPDEAARLRAASLALDVRGVVAVDNQLAVASKS